MDWVLGIDTSSVDMGLGLYNGTTPVAAYSRYVQNSHAEHITQAVSHLLSANGVSPEDINHIAIATGPGSFTGLRIGIAFAKGFSFTTNPCILPVSSLEILAHAARHHEGPVIAVLDARNNNVFWATFEFNNGIIKRITDDVCTPAENFADAIQPASAIVTDTMGYAKSCVFNFLKNRTNVFSIERYPIQRGLYCAATGSIHLSHKNQWIDSISLQPRYLRSSTPRTPPKKG